jgi:hypothetical protein
MMDDKKKSAEKLNEIQARVQEIFFELEIYTGHDPGNAALTKVIELMDEITKIRTRVLKKDILKNNDDKTGSSAWGEKGKNNQTGT